MGSSNLGLSCRVLWKRLSDVEVPSSIPFGVRVGAYLPRFLPSCDLLARGEPFNVPIQPCALDEAGSMEGGWDGSSVAEASGGSDLLVGGKY